MIKYRPDIDGLRAIAVLPVVFFHAGILGFGGGFVGVDIFFVISGYLITQILAREMADGTFSLSRFYVRRVRRIMPALIVVAVTTAVAGFYLLPSQQYADVGKAIRGVATFTANYFFMQVQGDYWNQNILAYQPLLHTWSLAVEEQFYIIFPLLLFSLFYIFKSQHSQKLLNLFGDVQSDTRINFAICFILISLAVSSLVLSQWLLKSNTTASFYLLTSRAWELLIGGLLAIYLPLWLQRNWVFKIFWRELAGVSGLVMIVFSVIFFNSRTIFPGLTALLPCLGAALIIFSGTRSTNEKLTIISSLIGNRLFISIGLISYSLYLWHWPVLVFMRSLGWSAAGLPTPPVAVQIAIMFILAWASWKFIEQPFRKSQSDRQVSARWLLSVALSILVMLYIIGYAVTKIAQKKTSLIQPLPLVIKNLEIDSLTTPGVRCEGSKLITEINENGGGCLLGKKGIQALPTFALVGDSHARMYTDAVDVFAKEHDISALVLARSSCIPLLGVIPPTRSECSELTEATIDYLVKSPIKHVVLAGYWVDILDSLNRHDDFEIALKSTVEKLQFAGKKVYVMRDVPELSADDVGMRSAVISIRDGGMPVFDMTIQAHIKTQKTANDSLDSISKSNKIILLDPAEYLCQSKGCLVAKDGYSMYRDKHHLTDRAAVSIRDIFLPMQANSD